MITKSNLSLLAETRLGEVISNYREEAAPAGMSGWWYALIPVAAIVISLVIYMLADRPPTIVNTPLGMLHELCRVHRIKGYSRTLLEEIAEAASMTQPATMFLGKDQFDEAVKLAKSKISFDKKQTSTLGMIRRRTFA